MQQDNLKHLAEKALRRLHVQQNTQQLCNKDVASPMQISVSSCIPKQRSFESVLMSACSEEIVKFCPTLAASRGRVARRMRRHVVPQGFTESTECARCGIVPIYPGMPAQMTSCVLGALPATGLGGDAHAR